MYCIKKDQQPDRKREREKERDSDNERKKREREEGRREEIQVDRPSDI